MTSEQQLQALFRRVIADPRLRDRPANRLEFGATDVDDSYFRPVERPRLGRADMEPGPDADVLDELERIWREAGSDLAGIVPHLRAISRTKAEERRAGDRPSAKVSDFIYQMW